ncbi:MULTISPECIES: hypothetical protein [unclassified Frankia]|uniref:hypothetical protein n=1 Tax=unclassified Frankia TaxID=2632575 RepID=UPI002AD29BB2|nr:MULTISPECIES: hypothetical protein [unclassified Frankia]
MVCLFWWILAVMLSFGGMPQDIKIDPRGEVRYVADMMANGLHLVDPVRFVAIGFLPTGKGTHGLYPTRDATAMYGILR